MRSFFAVSLSSLGSLLLLGALLPGCEGGQTGDLSGNSDGGTSNVGETGGGCDEHKQKLAGLDTQTDSGSGEDVLGYAEKSFDAPIVWQTAGEGQSWELAPETGEGKLHLEVTRGTSAYALSYTQKQGGNANLDLAAICPPPALGVEVHVDVKTDGGALAESFDTLLRVRTPGVAELDVPLDLSKLGGDLKVSFAEANSKLVQPHLSAVLTPAGMTGALTGTQETTSGTIASGSQALLAVWPGDAACANASNTGEGIAAATDVELLGATGADTVASIAPAEAIAVTWLDGSSATLEIKVDEQGDGCFSVDSTPVEIGGGPRVAYPVKLSLKSSDAHLDGTYDGQVIVHRIGNTRSVELQVTLLLAPADVAQSGFSDVTVPAGTNRVGLEVRLQTRDGVTSGSLRLTAISDPPCVTDPPPPMSSSSGSSAPGCSGSMVQQLESTSW